MHQFLSYNQCLPIEIPNTGFICLHSGPYWLPIDFTGYQFGILDFTGYQLTFLTLLVTRWYS